MSSTSVCILNASSLKRNPAQVHWTRFLELVVVNRVCFCAWVVRTGSVQCRHSASAKAILTLVHSQVINPGLQNVICRPPSKSLPTVASTYTVTACTFGTSCVMLSMPAIGCKQLPPAACQRVIAIVAYTQLQSVMSIFYSKLSLSTLTDLPL